MTRHESNADPVAEAHPDRGYTAPPAGEPASGEELRHLLAPITPAQFLDEHWSRRSLYIPGGEKTFAWLFDLERFRSAATRAARRGGGRFQLAAHVKSRPDEPLTLTYSDPIEPDQVDAVLARGDSVCATDIGAGDSRLSSYADAVCRQLGFAGTARFNCYLSPGGVGASLHFDVRMSTTLQIDGRKRWRFATEPSIAWPPSGAQLDQDGHPVWMYPWIADDGWTALRRPAPAELEEVVLEPGDVLCVPAGCWHEACAVDGPSLALNLSFGAVSFADMLRTLLTQAFDGDEAWRSGPPPVSMAERSADMPAAVQQYLAARLRELASFVDDLDPAGPQLAALWRGFAGG
jgi:hypothetical protein